MVSFGTILQTTRHCRLIISKRMSKMNPYASTNLLHPTLNVDYRTANNRNLNTGADFTVSRAAYRLVNAIERILTKSGS